MDATPWWGKTQLRLIVLLVILAGVAAYGLPRIIRQLGGETSRTQCGPTRVPTAPNWSLADVKSAVASSGLRFLRGTGTPDTEGLQTADAAWNDRYPTPLSAPDPAIIPATAGYEIRWWSQFGDHQAADLFVFSTSSDAARFLTLAATTPCRTDAVSRPVSDPAGGRAVVWTNPVGALQADVIFARRERVYVISEVPARGSEANDARLVVEAQQMACDLPDADCPHLLALGASPNQS